MKYVVRPLSCDPTKLNGLSEKLIVSHWENNYGGAVRRLNAITAQLAELDFAKAPVCVINGLKREELIATNSMILHELYFDSLPVWRDPDRVDEWIGELAPDRPVAVYCAYGFHVGCSVTKTLRERGFDARYIRGGVSAWYATGGPRALRPNAAS